MTNEDRFNWLDENNRNYQLVNGVLQRNCIRFSTAVDIAMRNQVVQVFSSFDDEENKFVVNFQWRGEKLWSHSCDSKAVATDLAKRLCRVFGVYGVLGYDCTGSSEKYEPYYGDREKIKVGITLNPDRSHLGAPSSPPYAMVLWDGLFNDKPNKHFVVKLFRRLSDAKDYGARIVKVFEAEPLICSGEIYAI